MRDATTVDDIFLRYAAGDLLLDDAVGQLCLLMAAHKAAGTPLRQLSKSVVTAENHRAIERLFGAVNERMARSWA